MDRRAWYGLLLVPAAAACRSPTQISVHVQTDVPCTAVTATSFTSGELGAIESNPPTTEGSTCSDGHLGTLVLVPSGEDDALVGFKVVTALNGDTIDHCASLAAANDTSCIVSRRALRYLPHTALSVIVDMSKACEGQICDANSTCVAGVCKDATIADPSACEGDGCAEGVLASEGDDGGAVPDATLGERIAALPPDLGTPFWSVALPNGDGVYPIVFDTPVVGPDGLVYLTMELGQGLPDGGSSYGLYGIGP